MEKKNKPYERCFPSTKKLFEMANISPSKTGLPVMIWISYNTGKEKHSARVKIKIDNVLVPITISDAPEVKGSNIKIKSKVLNPVFEWIIKNKKILLKYWNAKGNMGIDDLIDNLKK
jgi:hypothetical protein